jgi:DNA-binding beta-propeller fold protein YncE
MLRKDQRGRCLGKPAAWLIVCAMTCLCVTTGRLSAQAANSPMQLEIGYTVTQKFAVPGEGGWDYIEVDGAARRIYVSHGDVIQVLNADSGKMLGEIAAPGAHGIALARNLNRGFTSNGKDKTVTIFDINTLTVIKSTKLEAGTDSIVYDPFTKRVFPINQRITVLDAQSGDVAGAIDLGGDPEAAVSDGKGTVYVNLSDKGAVAVVDPKAMSVTKTYPITNCTMPHSLSYDGINERLFIGCTNGRLAILDAISGQVVTSSLMCSGVDAAAFDADSKLIFESCSEGVISVIRQMTPDNYRLIATIPTKLWARTMALDPKTKSIYLPTADFEFIPDADPKKPPDRRWKAGSFQVLVVVRH